MRVLMAVLLFLTFAAWSMGSAVGSTPDEGYVLTSIWCGETGATPYCRVDPSRNSAVILPIMAAEPQLCYVGQGQDYSAACQEAIYNQEISTDQLNRGLYPETYMNVARKFVSSDIEGSVVRIRLFNSFIACVMILFALSINRRQDSDLFITWLAVIAPVTTYFISSVNTSSWTLIGTTCFVFALIAAIRNRKDKKLLIAASLLTVFSVWFTNSSRYEGKYVLLLLGAAVIYSEFAPGNLQLNKKTALIGAAILSILFFIYSQFADLYSRINIFSDSRFEITEGVKTTANNLLIQNFLNLPRFIMGFFGGWGLGWFELEMTHTVWLFAMQAFLLTTVFALYKSDNVHRTILGGLLAVMCVAILYANQQTFTKVGNVIQPRYFLPFFLGIVIIAVANKTARFPNSLVITVAILATISNSIALRDTIRRYTTGQDVFISKSLNNPREWWWQFGPQPETVWLIGTLAFAALWALLIYDRNKLETLNMRAI
jgi:hypothetical protein